MRNVVNRGCGEVADLIHKRLKFKLLPISKLKCTQAIVIYFHVSNNACISNDNNQSFSRSSSGDSHIASFALYKPLKRIKNFVDDIRSLMRINSRVISLETSMLKTNSGIFLVIIQLIFFTKCLQELTAVF